MKTKKLLISIIVTITFTANLTFGQSHRNLPMYRYFNATSPDSLNTLDSTSITYGGWSIQSPLGTRAWSVRRYTTNYYAGCNGYLATGQVAQEQWFISPGFSTINYPDATLNFVSCDKFAGTPMAVLVSTNYDGLSLPATATWTDITNNLIIAVPNTSGPRVWTESGNVSLSTYSGNNVYVGFKYTCNATTATDWELDSISITSAIAGIESINGIGDAIFAYPNPCRSKLKIRNEFLINKIEIYNTIGDLVSSFENVNNKEYTVNVSAFQNGIYFTKIQLVNGNIVSKKLIKE